ncbi:MAG: TolC family protein [Proteobacteria bacterium]|nr:TolC family protein [Pseudomonadota bacterium]MDA0941681.1 TolC family protein [Pseudomonadota bacterium]MDA1034511.1 TolC family protein [Pseudomonadota bacterium]
MDLSKINDHINVQTPSAESFQDFLSSIKEVNFEPIDKGWNIDSLLAALYFFNTQIKIAEKDYQSIKANEVIAKFRPQSSIGLEIGSGNNANDEISNDIAGLNLLFPFETANKRLIRYEIALNTSQSSYENYRLVAWNERLKLVNAVIQYVFQIKKIKVIKNELITIQAIYNMNLRRFENGINDQLTLHQAKLDLQVAENKLKNLQLEQINLRKLISQTTGVRVNFLEKNPILADNIINGQLTKIAIFHQNQVYQQWNEEASLSRIDLRKSLANYAISEANLKLEVAKQYPDIKFNPAYLYDYGNKIWTLGITSLIPNIEKNKALILRAEKIRDVEASRIIDLQLQLVNDADNVVLLLDQAQQKFENAKNLLTEKENLLTNMQKKYNQGLISRYELEKEKIKLYEIDYIYLDSLYNLVISGFEIEKTYQKPFVSKLIIEKQPNE